VGGDIDIKQIVDFPIHSKAPILVETALLGCGLTSLEDELLLYLWPAAAGVELLWLEEGKLQAGLLPCFLEVRGKEWPRVNGRELAETAARGAGGFLTASALLCAAAALPGEERRIVVTAGMGGMRQGTISADLHELARSPDLLLASAFKDSLEVEPSLAFLRKNGVRLLGWQCEHLDGFLFHESPCALDGSLKTEAEVEPLSFREDGKSIVLFNPLPLSLRLEGREILAAAVERLLDGMREEVGSYAEKTA
jgi:pseudouridine-5'-phosphate glycosidase